MSEKINLSNYVLSEDDEFMNASQRAYFRAKLVDGKRHPAELVKPSATLPKKVPTIPTSPTGHPPKPTVPSSFVPATVSAS